MTFSDCDIDICMVSNFHAFFVISFYFYVYLHPATPYSRKLETRILTPLARVTYDTHFAISQKQVCNSLCLRFRGLVAKVLNIFLA